jgi:NhaP-type Na+/H+ or K+/H+ antiporter
MAFDSYPVLIFLSVIVILSYIFNLFARRWKFPAVLFLLGLGVVLRYGGAYFHLAIGNIQLVLELFGIVGMILIVLEAALDIKLSASSIPIVGKSFEVALVVFALGVLAIGSFFHYWFLVDWRVACINAIPLVVISSAIVIPSICHLPHRKREFLVYEATISDILGILVFNYIVQHSLERPGALLDFGIVMILTVLVSLISSLFLLYMVTRIRDHVKIFIILSIMVLLYSLGKMMHLSPLLLIFVFGLLLSNSKYFFKKKFSFLRNDTIAEDFGEFKLVVAESSFVVRTFFFVMFGYSMDFSMFLNADVLLIGSLILCILLGVRFLYLKFFARVDVFPELFIAPKGLVSILLFYSIPASALIPFVGRGVLFFVIFVSSIMMAAALFEDHRRCAAVNSQP